MGESGQGSKLWGVGEPMWESLYVGRPRRGVVKLVSPENYPAECNRNSLQRHPSQAIYCHHIHIFIKFFKMAAPAMSITWRDSADENLYEKERVDRVFNAIKPNRFPRAIVKATHPSHVQKAIQLANKLQCRVSVRSGGHSWAAWSVRDDAILIDLEGLHEIELDESKKIVKASPSTTGIMLNEGIGKKGFMFGGGHCPDVGIGGFLLQGGMGWNCKVRLFCEALSHLITVKSRIGGGLASKSSVLML